jgi:two-component system chemotaxis sensor kinase CheA
MNLSTDITAEDIDVFLQESEEQLRLLDEDIVRLEKEQDAAPLLQEIFRAAHTLKGSSGMLGYDEMTRVAHAMENMLDSLRKGTLAVNTDVVDALLASLDVLVELNNGLANSETPDVDIASVLTKLDEASDGSVASGLDKTGAPILRSADLVLRPEDATVVNRLAAEGNQTYGVDVTLEDGTVWAAVRCFQLMTALEDVGRVIVSRPTADDIEQEKVESSFSAVISSPISEDELRTAIEIVEDVTALEIGPYEVKEEDVAAQANGSNGQARANDRSQTLRIDVERLDHLMNLIGELVIDRTRMTQITKTLDSRYHEDDMVQALSKTSSHITKVVDELQEGTLTVRMLPVGTVFGGLPRMVRDLAVSVKKNVDLVVTGQDTEIDRTVIERIRDPLVHLLRNSVDHGIETPEERLAAGKSETGTLKLSAAHAEGYIVISVEDDGKGIDCNKIKDTAVNKGLIPTEAAERLTESEMLDLIFLPGMSTAKKTTEVSGRGVGMDIVRANIEAINGFVKLDTKLGEGTKFTLRLPLTLATVQALLITVGEGLYAVPVVHVLEAVSLSEDDIGTIEGDAEVFRLRGQVVPLLRLGPTLGMKSASSEIGSSAFVVVVRLGERMIGLGVDSLTELQEIVVKSIGKYTGEAKGVAGASIWGDGRVMLILDVPTLISMAVANPR